MKANNIFIQSMPLLTVTECEIRKEVNSHFSAAIKGYLEGNYLSDYDEYIKKDKIEVIFVDDNHEPQSFFRGIITSIALSTTNNYTELVIKAESYTKLLELKENFRVFQDENLTYKKIASYIVECHENAVSIYNRNTDQPTGGLIVQYRETDWGFLKRIAASVNTLLISDCRNDKASFYFGIPERTKVNDITYLSVVIKWVMENGRKVKVYVIESTSILNLLDKVLIQGESAYIYAINTQMIDGEIVSQYELRYLKDFYSEKYYNTKLAGVSVTGQVEAVKDTQVQVDIDNDSVRCKGKRRWFDFATVYSSSEGTGWYCMPECGDKIRLYFPNDNEKNAYVISSVHSEEKNDLRTDPEEKFIRTIHDKEVRLTPSKILLTNHKGMQITLDDETGITIKSNKDITIESNGAINIESGDGIELEADTGVYLRQKRNMLMVRDGICEQGLNIEHR